MRVLLNLSVHGLQHVFVVLTNPAEGREDAYNSWYTNIHLGDVLNVPGIVTAQRFKLSDAQRGEPPFPWRYLALYEIDTDDLIHTITVLKERSGTSAMMISDALAPERLAWFFQPITPRVEAAKS